MSCANEAALQTGAYMHLHELYTRNATLACDGFLCIAFCSVRCMFFVHRNCRFPVQLMKTVSFALQFSRIDVKDSQITHDTNPT